MSDVGELVVSAAQAGCLYGLVALAYLLIIRPTGVINFSLGEWSMLAAFGAVAATTEYLLPGLQLPFYVGAILVVVAIAIFAALVEWLTVRPLIERGAPILSPVLALLGVLVISREVGTIVAGPDPLSIDPPFGFMRLEIGPFAGAPQAFFIIATAIVVFVAAWLFFERTAWGKRFEAVAINRRAAALMGINLRLVGLMAFVGAGIVTAIVGILVAGGSGAFYQMGLPLAIQGFTALVIGGVGRVEGALLGGLILGFTEAVGQRYLDEVTTVLFGFGVPSGLIQGVPLVLLIIFLLVRPTGLLRAKEARL